MADTNQITVIVLCIAALIFLLADIFLVFSLHRHNKKLAKKSRALVKNEPPSFEEKDDKDKI